MADCLPAGPMTETAMPKRSRFWRYLLIAAGLLVLLAGVSAWYVTTDSFQQLVRRRLVVELERITGGRVDLGSIHTIPMQLRVEVRNLTIHGNEDPNQVPFAHVDRLLAKINDAPGHEYPKRILG